MVCQCTMGRWVRGNVIGAGSFGKVNLAINVGTGELFAVKSVDCSSSGGETAAMENELGFLRSLDSPFIVKCFGGDQTLENGVQMQNLFMEYMAGGSVADLMRRGGGALDEVLIRVYTKGLLHGLCYLHSQGVVHCDVKGKNVLIGASGVKIADFGSAKRVGADLNVVMRGTPLWMAPEVIMHLEQGPPSDIWSLGCTVVEMATGRPPWSLHGLNLFATLLRIGSKQDMPPFPDCLSAEGKDFLSKCLQRDPQQRWTAAQLLNHPFVQVQKALPEDHGVVSFCAAEEGTKVPLSPTSVLDGGMGTDTGTGIWDSNRPACTSVQLLHCSESDPRALLASGSTVAEGEEGSGRWITVRSPRLGGKERQRPLSEFMLGKGITEGMWSGGELHLQSLHFLRARRRASAGRPPPRPPTPTPTTAHAASFSND